MCRNFVADVVVVNILFSKFALTIFQAHYFAIKINTLYMIVNIYPALNIGANVNLVVRNTNSF